MGSNDIDMTSGRSVPRTQSGDEGTTEWEVAADTAVTAVTTDTGDAVSPDTWSYGGEEYVTERRARDFIEDLDLELDDNFINNTLEDMFDEIPEHDNFFVKRISDVIPSITLDDFEARVEQLVFENLVTIGGEEGYALGEEYLYSGNADSKLTEGEVRLAFTDPNNPPVERPDEPSVTAEPMGPDGPYADLSITEALKKQAGWWGNDDIISKEEATDVFTAYGYDNAAVLLGDLYDGDEGEMKVSDLIGEIEDKSQDQYYDTNGRQDYNNYFSRTDNNRIDQEELDILFPQEETPPSINVSDIMNDIGNINDIHNETVGLMTSFDTFFDDNDKMQVPNPNGGDDVIVARRKFENQLEKALEYTAGFQDKRGQRHYGEYHRTDFLKNLATMSGEGDKLEASDLAFIINEDGKLDETAFWHFSTGYDRHEGLPPREALSRYLSQEQHNGETHALDSMGALDFYDQMNEALEKIY